MFSADERQFLRTVSKLSYCNPFTAERLALERAALGDRYRPTEQQWNVYVGSSGELTNVVSIIDRLKPLLEQLRQTERDAKSEELYDDLVVFLLYHRFRSQFGAVLERLDRGASAPNIASLFAEFAEEVGHFYRSSRTGPTSPHEPELLFALAFQISRAFFYIYRFIIGASDPMIRLRAQIWESVFGVDLRRYRRSLAGRMQEFPTLVTGPSGTGKELVARAIGLSQFIPYDSKRGGFVEDFQLRFHPLNLSAFSPTLIESELFGHKRGSFTGAISDRNGWLSAAGPHGTVFLDEIGELELPIQVKLLRVLETRTFQKLGDTKTLRFEGKLVTATNRSLPQEVKAGKFREDLYYRLVGDQIETPSLRERLNALPEELGLLVRHLTRRLLPEHESSKFADEALSWIEGGIPTSYDWPGNVRELEQCLRNILIHGRYAPMQPSSPKSGALTGLFGKIQGGSIRAEELVDRYIDHVYGTLQNYEETGRRLGLDRRTVKARLIRPRSSDGSDQ